MWDKINNSQSTTFTAINPDTLTVWTKINDSQ